MVKPCQDTILVVLVSDLQFGCQLTGRKVQQGNGAGRRVVICGDENRFLIRRPLDIRGSRDRPCR